MGRVTGGQKHPSKPVPSRVHTQEYLPVVQAAIVVMILKNSALGEHPPSLLTVDVPLDAGLASTDENSMPDSQGAQGKCYGTAQEPEVDKTLVSHPFSEGEGGWWGLLIGLDGSISLPKKVPTAVAAVHTAQSHEEAERKKVPVIIVAHTVVKPGAVMIHLQHTPITDTAVVSSGWFGVNALLTDGDCGKVIPTLRGVSRWSGDGLIVVEDNEDQIPVTVEEMPAEPWHRVGLDDEGQHTQVGDGHNGAGQHYHKHHEHHPTPADHVVHQPVDRLEGSIDSSITAPKGVVEQGAQADLAIAPALDQAPKQGRAAAPIAHEQEQAQAETGRAQQQAPLAAHDA